MSVNDRQAAALGNLLIFGASLQRICLYDQTTGWTISQLYDCFIPHHQYPIPELLSLLPFHPEYTWSTTIMLFHTIFNYRLVAFDIVMPVLHAYGLHEIANMNAIIGKTEDKSYFNFYDHSIAEYFVWYSKAFNCFVQRNVKRRYVVKYDSAHTHSYP
ncbi:hypothetical protein T4B_1054, partial [Trichinella pseudospiralis]